MDNYILDVFSTSIPTFLKKYNLNKKQNQIGNYYSVSGTKHELKKIEKRLNRRNIKTRLYEKKWARSSNYRQIFLKNNNPPYKCRYCGKRLKKELLEVDHIVPVSKAKNNPKVRRLLKRRGIQDINDIRNLVASCHKCNKAKGDKLGIWYLKGVYGFKGRFILLLRFLIVFLIITILYFVANISLNQLHF